MDHPNKTYIEHRHKELISYAMRKLAFTEYLFFKTILYNFNWRVSYDTPKGALAFIILNPRDLGKILGGSINISHTLIEDPEFNYNNYIFVALHEALHVINGHGYRKGNRNPVLWNLAGDHTINIFLKELHNTEKSKKNPISPPGNSFDKIFICDELEKKGAKLTTEEVYDYLVRNLKDRYTIKKLDGDPDDNQSNDESEGDQGNSEDNGDSEKESPGQNKKNGKGFNWYEITDNKTGKKYYVNDKQLTEDEIKKEREIQAESRANYNVQKQRGLLSSWVTQYFDEILKIEIPWSEILKQAIKQNVIPKASGRDWRSLNKYLQAHGIALPGIGYDEEKDGIGTCIVSVDTSGSISTEELQTFAGIIYESLHQFHKVIVITHDVDIHQEMEFDVDTKEAFLATLQSEGFQGRGGTSHKPTFDRIEELYEEYCHSNQISMYISLTDGYSDVEEIWRKFKWSKENKIPTYFIITKQGKIMNIPGIEENTNPRQIQINSID